ncbi:MAG TPA: VCBS repeat-containing protein, partial [Pyrinomonadaceae bacterium]|nr:VCBS repeat-containing protein [Pyrinomonadaceae bacterium]
MKTISVRYRLQITFLLVISVVSFSFSSAFAQAQTAPRKAVVDFNGDNKTDFALMRPSANAPGAQYTWWIQNNGDTSNFTAVQLGLRAIDVPVPADYDGDGKTDIAMFRYQNTGANNDAGTWYILESSTNKFRFERFGQAGD